MTTPIISIKGLKNYLGNQWVHTDVNLEVAQGEIIAIIGGSGSGKTTIFRSLLLLQRFTAGEIKIFDQDILSLNEEQTNQLRRRWGVLFQHSALFSSMTVLENIMFPMQEFTHLDNEIMQELALLKISLVGLPIDAAYKFPSELSGGMQRRAAAARALSKDPELLFLDEPTTGLDPHSARQFDKLIVFLRKTLDLTVVMISHDLESLKSADRVVYIGEGRVIAALPLDKLMKFPHPMIAEYFNNS